MSFLLVSISGGESKTFDRNFTAGRGAELDIADEYATPQHARFTTDGSGWFVADLGSVNGTFVNGVKTWKATASGTVPLRKGDQVRIGRTILTVVPS